MIERYPLPLLLQSAIGLEYGEEERRRRRRLLHCYRGPIIRLLRVGKEEEILGSTDLFKTIFNFWAFGIPSAIFLAVL